MDPATFPPGALDGVRVLDLSRVLAGPWCTQILGDLGAEVYKVERPGEGDDTRRWGPPFLEDGSGDASYFLCCNRNKQALAVDLSTPEGAAVIRRLALECDVVVENFRVGALARYGLDAASLRAAKPSLVYCSITGFGQDGPNADRGGYDFLIQGMTGLMSVTGDADGGPVKAGVPVSDLFTGLYATIAILAALRHRDHTGDGQAIDCALFDTQLCLLANQAAGWLNGGAEPRRLGNAHPNVVPYQDFRTADGAILVALGSDRQFRGLCALLARDDLADDPAFADNAGRNANRDRLIAALGDSIATWPTAVFNDAMNRAGLPCGPVNSVPQALAEPQVAARGLVHEMARGKGPPARVLGFPARLSATPASYRRPPPLHGQDTAAVLANVAGLSAADLAALRHAGVIPANDQ